MVDGRLPALDCHRMEGQTVHLKAKFCSYSESTSHNCAPSPPAHLLRSQKASAINSSTRAVANSYGKDPSVRLSLCKPIRGAASTFVARCQSRALLEEYVQENRPCRGFRNLIFRHLSDHNRAMRSSWYAEESGKMVSIDLAIRDAAAAAGAQIAVT